MDEYVNKDLDKAQNESAIEQNISKSKLKKLLKREKWLAVKQEKRRASKQKRKDRLAEMRLKGEDVGPSRKKLKKNTMMNSSCKIKVVIDLSFDEYMAEKDINSLSCQIQHSYSVNRRAANPMQLYLCSLGGKAKERLDSIGDYKGWDIFKESKSYEQLFSKESIVYLSSESPNVLSSLSVDKVYVIGGLVDHNKHKGLCHSLAIEKGIAHAQLPISEYLNMKTRKVLAINHVFSILLKYTECGSWEEAFMSEMPQRLQAHLKEDEGADKKEEKGSSQEINLGVTEASTMMTHSARDNVMDLANDLNSVITEYSDVEPMHSLLLENNDILKNEENPETSPTIQHMDETKSS